jgi:predicted nucleic acid-binding protein
VAHLGADQVSESEAVLGTARQASALGVKAYDALHVGCAVAGGATIFVSKDDALLRRLRGFPGLRSALPAEALAVVDDWHED